MNSVILIGRLTKDVVLKKTTNGTSVVSFSLAVGKGKGEADFIQCVAYNQTADLMAKYLSKGAKIACDGRISTRNYDNEQGQKVFVTEVILGRVEFLDSKRTEEQSASYDSPLEITSDDLPF